LLQGCKAARIALRAARCAAWRAGRCGLASAYGLTAFSRGSALWPAPRALGPASGRGSAAGTAADGCRRLGPRQSPPVPRAPAGADLSL